MSLASQLRVKVILCNMWCPVLWGHCGGGVAPVGLRGTVSAGRGQGGHCGCSHTSPLSLHYEVVRDLYNLKFIAQLFPVFCIRMAAFICVLSMTAPKTDITNAEQRHSSMK
jgi:hypothetical protein